MNVLTQTWRQLVRRRLWPVAVLLVAALVAVPVVLAKPGTPDPAAAPPEAATAAAPVQTPAPSYVKLAADDASTKDRHVLGARKDPFEPAPLPKVKHHKKKKAAAKQAATAQATATPTDSAPTTPSAPSTPVEPVPTVAPAPVKHVPANSVDVKFGKVGGDLAKRTLQRDDTLPASSPLIVFMGFHKGGKVAEFMLTGTVTAEGDGTCTPSPQSCETLLLHKGETEFLTFSGTSQDGQYELDVKDL
ncbi:MAG TPA: hypothetical protein VGI54_05600, partial [Solirubrobacteraceae bacterium]